MLLQDVLFFAFKCIVFFRSTHTYSSVSHAFVVLFTHLNTHLVITIPDEKSTFARRCETKASNFKNPIYCYELTWRSSEWSEQIGCFQASREFGT